MRFFSPTLNYNTANNSLRQATRATHTVVELISIQYEEGLTNFQNLLDMQRFLFGQKDALATSEGQAIQTLNSLYSALGGGWEPEEIPWLEPLQIRNSASLSLLSKSDAGERKAMSFKEVLVWLNSILARR